MKNKISLITLIACAAAGTTFAADPVRAFRASSGTTTNSADATYVGNPVWASDAQQIGEKYVADLFLAYESPTFTWDSELNAFCRNETGYGDDDPTHHGGSYWQINAVFALTGTAQFTNAADAAMSFRCESETAEHYSGYDPERKEYFTVDSDNLILFADSSKFTNEGTISYESYFTGTAGGTYEDWNNGKPIGFSVFLRDDAVFENAGTISAEPDNYVECVSYNLFGNAKFVNAASGKIRGIDLWLSGDSVFENAGTIVNRGVSSTDDIYITLRENAKLVNTGTIDSDKYNFSFEAGFSGTSKIENRGTMTGADVDFRIGNDPILGISASFENYGTIKPEENSSSAVAFGVNLRDLDKSGNDVDFRDLADAYTETMRAGDLNVKNFGTIDLAGTGTMSVLSGVKLTLAQGSTIAGNLEVGKNLEFYLDNTFCTLHIDEDVLNIELTGQGENAPLISGDLELCNRIELDVSFAEDAVKKTKYELTIWGGELTLNGKDWIYDPETGEYIQVHHDSGFIKTTGTLDAFGTTYEWSLDTATGVLTAKDVNIGEEIDLTSPTQNVELGEKDVATLDPSLTEYSGTVSGAGQVSSSGDVEFSGDASELTGTLSVDAGTFTVAEGAKLGEKATLDVAGTLALEGDRTLPNTLSGAGTLETAGVVALSGDASAFSGTTAIRSGTLTVAESAELGTGAFDVAGALALEGDRALSNTLSGAGQVSSSGDVEFSGDASALTGTLSVNAGTFTIAESAKLGEKATLDVAGTLALEGERTISNATSGDGAIELAAGATVKFAKEVGVKTLNVSEGAELKGGVKLTSGAEAVLTIAGTLALDAAAGEKVALGTGKTVLAPTAKLRLDAAGGNAAGASFMAAGDAAPLENGGSVVIFENGTVEGDVVAFLGTDQTLAALAAESAVIYDATNGLSVQSLKNPSALTSYVDTSDLSSSFVGWALGGLEKDLANLQPGFVSKDDLGGLDSNDPLLNALLAGDAGTARSILDRLSPKSFAAMIAMPVETFHDDVRSVAARLEQRRHDAAAGVDGDWQFFAQAQMISAENDTASDAPTFDFDRYGALAGADVKLDETMLLGVAVGAGTGDADIHNGGGKIESTDFRALAYFGKTFAERFYVNAGAQLGFASYDVKRRSDYGDANADVDGWNAGAFAEAGAAFAISETHGLYATPYVGLAYAHAEADSFKEDGGKAAFDADSLSGDSLRARIGCAFSWGFDVAGARWRVGLDAAYSRELLDDEIDVDVTASDGSRISETAAALPEDVFSIGPTLNVDVSVSASVYAGYAFNAGTDSSTAHSANVGFRLRF